MRGRESRQEGQCWIVGESDKRRERERGRGEKRENKATAGTLVCFFRQTIETRAGLATLDDFLADPANRNTFVRQECSAVYPFRHNMIERGWELQQTKILLSDLKPLIFS